MKVWDSFLTVSCSEAAWKLIPMQRLRVKRSPVEYWDNLKLTTIKTVVSPTNLVTTPIPSVRATLALATMLRKSRPFRRKLK